MKCIYWTLTAPLALAATAPAFAQEIEDAAPPTIETVESSDDDSAYDDPMEGLDDIFGGLFGDAFKAQPLTAEQEARLPQANLISSRILPDGTFAKVMEETFKPMLDAIMGGLLSTEMDYPLKDIARLAGIDQSDLMARNTGQLAAVTAILDPAYKQRTDETMEVTLGLVTKMMTKIEPAYRDGLARAYAQRLSNDELAEINNFFETPVGGKYAAESLLVHYDPQVMSAMNELMPIMFELLPEMASEIAELEAKYPAARKFEELDASEQKQLSALLGVPVETLAENAANIVDEDDMSWDYDEEETAEDGTYEEGDEATEEAAEIIEESAE